MTDKQLFDKYNKDLCFVISILAECEVSANAINSEDAERAFNFLRRLRKDLYDLKKG